MAEGIGKNQEASNFATERAGLKLHLSGSYFSASAIWFWVVIVDNLGEMIIEWIAV